MENLMVAEARPALLEAKGKNYRLNIGNTQTVLRRDIDFGIIPGTSKPSLFKSGAEAIAMGYGLLQHYDIVTSVENWDGDTPFFMYTVRCDLVKIFDGKEYIFSTAFGSANTREKRNGRNDAFNGANTTLKMAMKRALTSACIAVSGLSSAFTMDIEDSGFNKEVDAFQFDTSNPDDKISTAQAKRLFTIANKSRGMSNVEVKAWLKEHYKLDSTKDITRNQYDDIINELQKGE